MDVSSHASEEDEVKLASCDCRSVCSSFLRFQLKRPYLSHDVGLPRSLRGANNMNPSLCIYVTLFPMAAVKSISQPKDLLV
jgi:hypothetical protein